MIQIDYFCQSFATDPMKKLLNYRQHLLLLFLPLLFISCETDFELNAEWKDYTIVYGILNQNDSMHYIRIQKAFLGDGNVLHMAIEPDSNLYPGNLSVKIEEWVPNLPNQPKVYVLDTISIDDKEPGVFFSPNQQLYYFQANLNQNANYKLIITNSNTGKVISSETGLVGDFGISRPVANTIINFDIPNNPTRTFAWKQAKNAGRYQMIIRFNYLEENTNTNEIISKFIDWNSPVIKAGSGGGDVEIRFNNETFFTLVQTRIPFVGIDVIRYPVNIELIFLVAATELSTYIEVNEPSSSLIQEKPEYTNIENGLGVFSARFDKRSFHPLHPFTIDRLEDMEGLNFQRMSE
jgi:hypothetical protein